MKSTAWLAVWSMATLFSSAAFAQSAASSSSARPASAPAQASNAKAGASPIQTQFKAYKVHFNKDGREELEAASNASPGDVIEYVAQHRNVSQRRLLNVDFAIPIPWGTTLWEGSVQPANGKLMMASGQAKSGKDKDRARVVWRVEQLDPGLSVEFKLRVSIDPDPTLTPARPVNPFAPQVPQLRR
ncbi:MAG: hypothetical protein ACKO1L_13200 [Brachymonas sp.]